MSVQYGEDQDVKIPDEGDDEFEGDEEEDFVPS